MLEALKPIIDIQELDIKMIRLMRMKKQRSSELVEIEALSKELEEQENAKKEEIQTVGLEINKIEEQIAELTEKLKKLETQQSSIKKVEEFNAMTQEITAVERQKIALEQEASNLLDKKSTEEEILVKIRESLTSSQSSSINLKDEIQANIDGINEEGASLKVNRDKLAETSDRSILAIYERLLRNKKDRVIVPIENRTCSGCHIALTLQHENLVRKADNVVFCEHCSRIHYWPEEAPAEETTTKSRRRRATASS